ncbi:hypothetical protein F511_23069 [Dorcoceras hygrometricum]|uniref:Late embryogenesis abundant protein LEA-2 subgroup domain-containing protein n=1 Tax=Dorcoceras hygrometricum TaxID=472368 RepID=A0A2Z7A7B8_9LAMI|nr:hypothetical protein F511_23069 [Dorcoceras hygrometricum]
MKAKHCGHNPHHHHRKKLYRCLVAAILGFIVLALLLILVIYLILRPTKPQFVLQEATFYAFNLSAANLLSTSLRVTLSSRNPNDRIGIYYDELQVYGAYHSQQITSPSLLPSSYQGQKDTTVWSSNLNGNSVAVAPNLGVELKQDRLMINVRVDGRIRWRVAAYISGKYHLHVNCPAYVSFGSESNGVSMGPAINYQLIMKCHVHA